MKWQRSFTGPPTFPKLTLARVPLSPGKACNTSMAESSLSESMDERPKPPRNLSPPTATATASKAFAFWAYIAFFVTLLAVLLSLLRPAPSEEERRSWFLSLPDDLRVHHSAGKFIKVTAGASRVPVEIFAVEAGPRDSENGVVLLVHGLGCSSFSFRRVIHSLAAVGIRAVALDLPGAGFSQRLDFDENRAVLGGVLGDIWGVFREIQEKGIFYGFDQLVETGGINYEQIGARKTPRKEGGDGPSSVYGPEEMARVLQQVIDSMALAPVHLVFHDSALGAGLNLVSTNPGVVRSVTLLDPSASLPAFPWRILGTPVLGQMLLKSRFLFRGLLRLCCSRSIREAEAEAHMLLLKAKEGRKAVITAGKALNYSFDLGEWTRSEAVKDLPLQILWSNMWSDKWIDEGKIAAAAVPTAKFAHHSGGKWPQEDAADEISRIIVNFVTSFPKLAKQKQEEHHPGQIDENINTANNKHFGHQHQHRHQHYHDDHEHTVGYADMYGLNHGWDS